MKSLPRIIKSSSVNMGQTYKIQFFDDRQSNEEQNYNPQKEIEVKKSIDDISHNIIHEAQEEAKNIIINAQKKANQLIQKAEENQLQIKEEAIRKGYEEGYQKGYDIAQKDAEKIIIEAKELMENTKNERKKVLEGIEEQVIEFSLEIASNILKETLNDKPQYIMDIIYKGIERVVGEKEIVIYVSADDYPYVVNNKENIIKKIENIEKVEIKKDSHLQKSQCIIEASFGNIDCSLDTQYKNIKNEFQKIIRNG